MADFLGAEGLQKLAANKYSRTESLGFESKPFMESVRLVFGNTVRRTDSLRQKVLAIAVKKHEMMKAVPTEYEKLLMEVGEFAACLALEL